MVPPSEHLARMAQADLALDCFPYGSHTTARLITRSLADYYGLALRLAGDREELKRLKARDLERAFTAIWERHRGGLPPDDITLD